MVREILLLGNPLLRERAREITDPAAPEVHRALADLRHTLHDFQQRNGFGRGISAVQIGEPLRLIYIELGGREYSILNPEILAESQQKLLVWDDCFSFPDLVVRLVRSAWVELKYQDAEGRAQALRADNDFSELLQHEMDHLDGVLAVDRAIDRHSLATRAEYERRYKDQRIVPVRTGGTNGTNGRDT